MNSYNELESRYKKIHNLSHLGSIVGWDQAAMMPSGSNEARANAISELRVLLHQMRTDKAMGELLEKAASEDLNETQKSSLREMTSSYNKSTIIPEDLVKAQTLAGSKCEHAWRTQRGENDWNGFLKNFEEVVKLSREEATIRSESTGLSKYDSLVDLYEPGMKSEQLDSIFSDVKSWLPKLIEDIVEKQKSENVIEANGPFPIAKQKELGLAVMKKLGFDFNQGRVDESVHPFCGGVPEDVRMTTRYDESDFVQSLMGIVHETGHARYEQNLPRDLVHLPSGRARSMGIHESQSLLFEMSLGRGKEFLNSISKDVTNAFGDSEAFGLENLAKIYTRVKPGYIRVDADEVTYPAHVILRYEIERALVNGEIEATDIPELWNQKMKDYLGVNTKGNFKDGPLQDIHWTSGSFGYFPSYTLGAMYAAQQFGTIKIENPDVLSKISNGDYSQVFAWLDKNIWKKASLFSTDELMIQATGEVLNPTHFKEHLISRYL